MRTKMRDAWLSMPILGKSRVFAGLLIFIVTLMALVDASLLTYTFRALGTVLQEISSCEDAQDAMQKEEQAFRADIRQTGETTQEELLRACEATAKALENLPFDYASIGAERYGRTWNIHNAYAAYQRRRDQALSANAADTLSVPVLYEVYDAQGYLRNYLQSLTQLTVEDASTRYGQLRPALMRMPILLLVFALAIAILLYFFSRFFTDSIVKPVRALAEDAGRIASDDFSGADVRVENRDELGELVLAFGRMKRSMGEHIQTLNEKHALEERLHGEEMGRIEAQKQLGEARLTMLRSQIKPHFLFNTLNSISGMAAFEDAEVTEKMIVSLSNIFRYNLQTTEPFTSLRQDLRVLQDYLYLQQMRFGDRMRFSVEVAPDVDTGAVLLPVFLLQPLVENAIVHGIAGKEQGGEIKIEVGMDEEACAVIRVKDDGIGISPERMEELQKEFAGGTAGKSGHIGLGNAYERIHSIYPDGDLTVESSEGNGTCVTVVIPQTVSEEAGGGKKT